MTSDAQGSDEAVDRIAVLEEAVRVLQDRLLETQHRLDAVLRFFRSNNAFAVSDDAKHPDQRRVYADRLVLENREGEPLVAGLISEGEGVIMVRGTSGAGQVSLHSGPHVSLSIAHGSEWARMVLRLVEGSPQLAFFDEAGKSRVLLSLDSAENGRLVFLDASGNVVWSAP